MFAPAMLVTSEGRTNLYRRFAVNTVSSRAPQDKPHYVYALYYPDGRIFYVGKGTGNRINDHEKYARNSKRTDHKSNIIRKIWREGEQVIKEILARFETQKEAFQYEIALIFFMDGLTNQTNGGEGASGREYSEEHRNKLSEATRKQWASSEMQHKMSESAKTRVYTEGGRRKLRVSNKRRASSEDWRRKMSDAHKGRAHSEETRRKMSETHKRLLDSEEARRKQSEHLTKRVRA